MRKMTKIILIVIMLFAVFISGEVTLLIARVNQDTVKSEIVQIVHNKTGGDLAINGEAQWTFFPWFGIKINDIVLKGGADLQKSEAIKVGEIGFSVKLLPLLSGRITIGHLTLKNFSLPLSTASVLLKHNKQELPVSSNVTSNKNLASKSYFNIENITVDDIDIENGRVFWQDQQTNKKFEISKVNLRCKNIRFNELFKVETSFYLQNSNSVLNGQVKANAGVKLDLVNKLYVLNNLRLSGKLVQSLEFDGAANVEIDLNKQKLVSENFKLHFADVVTTGSLYGNNIIDAPNFTGSLVINKIDIDALVGMTTTVTSPKDSSLQNNKSKTTSTSVSSSGASSNSPAIRFTGDLKVGVMRVKKLNFDNFYAKIISNKGLINCPKVGFDFYRGHANGSAVIDVHGGIPQINLKLLINNVAMQPLLVDVAKYNEFSGAFALNTNISMRGATGEAMLSSLSGSGNVSITGGSYHGVDIPYEVRRASALLNNKAMPQESRPPHTDFDRLTMSFKITNALLNTNDFLVQALDYKVTGQGSANISSQQLDLRLSAYSTHDNNFFVPIKILGSFTKPSIKPDMAVMIGQVVKKEIGKQLQKLHVPKELLDILPMDKLL